MAIDTQNKRRSVGGYCAGLAYPVPDGTVGTADRAHIAWLYAGLTYSGVVAAVADVIGGIARRMAGRC